MSDDLKWTTNTQPSKYTNACLTVSLPVCLHPNYIVCCFARNIDRLQLDNIMGFILNVPTDFSWGVVHLPVYRKHWIAIREINDAYYNLDSKLNAPVKIKDVLAFLKEQIESKEKELLLVVSAETSEAGTWYRDNVTQEHVAQTDINGSMSTVQ